jgi:methyl-accepting chemotaxis protein
MTQSLSSMRISKRIYLIPLTTCLFLVLLWIALLLQMKNLTLGFLIVGVALSFLITLAVSKTILVPISKINDAIVGVAQGDLTRRIDLPAEDEIGEAANHFNASMEKLLSVITHFTHGSYVVSRTAYTLDNSSRQMNAGMSQAVIQVNSVAAAGEEMSTTSSEIAHNCLAAAKSSEKANQSALIGQSIADETLAVMDRIDDIVKASATIIRGLGARSDEIGGVINLINDIADQTNLLALNAAIEAARAGEHGRGFAVVADEVRKLAEKTTEATKGIGNTIKAMQSETQRAVTSMEEGVKAVENGTEEAKKSDGALKDILQQISAVSAEINQIAVASEQQTATINELAQNIQQISEAIQQTAGSLNQNTGVISQVAELSMGIQRTVNQFKMATEEDASNLLKKAGSYIRANGREKAFAEFSNPNGDFVKNGLYIIVQDFSGTLLLGGIDQSMIGKNVLEMKDYDGRYFVKEIIEIAKTKGEGIYESNQRNPTTKVIQKKVYYFQRIDDYYISCGVYK